MEKSINIERLKTGDEQEFKKLYTTFFPSFFSFALQYVKDNAVARDIVQDVFIAYRERQMYFTDIVSLKVFLYRSIRNKCLNTIRDNKHFYIDISELHYLESKEFLEEGIIQQEIALAVRQQIAKLTLQEQKILKLSLLGKSVSEVAELLQISINTVKTHKLNAYSKLRLWLRDLHQILSFVTII